MRRYALPSATIIFLAILVFWLWRSNRTDIFTREDDIAATGDLAEIRLRFMVTQVQRYGLQKGRLPETVSVLVDEGYLDREALDDPFAPGKEIRYRRLADGQFLLWSVGPDGKDDGGEPNLYENRVTDNSKGDIALEGTVQHLLNREK